MLRDTYIEINLDRLAGNVRRLRERIGGQVAIAAVVKADAYGHGSVACARTIMENGGSYLAVATLTEALELRHAWPEYPILIMGYTSDENLPYIVKHHLTQCIFTWRQAKLLSDLGCAAGIAPKIHIKYDTGFHRIGFPDCPESIQTIREITQLPQLDCEGIFSHFALENDAENHRQFQAFTAAVRAIGQDGFRFRYCHICDSITAVDYPEFRLSMIRPGAVLYGMKSFRKNDLDVRQVIRFVTKVSYVQNIKAGDGISYNYKFKAPRDMRIATIQAGYADGYPRNMFGVGEVTIRGRRAPVVGVVCMDQSMVDVTDIPEVSAGDEVILYGDAEDQAVTFAEAAARGQTNKNELLCRFTRRTPKVYLQGGRVVSVSDPLVPEEWKSL